MTRRRAAVCTVGVVAAVRWWWRSGYPPFPIRLAVLIWAVHGKRKGVPEPVRSGPPSEALP